MRTNNFNEIPIGIFVIEMFHESRGKKLKHLSVKREQDKESHEHMHLPFYSEGMPGYEEFWDWAEKNLPIYEYPYPVKAAY